MQSNTVCLLTGAIGGIGQAIAKQLDKSGVQLVLHGRRQDQLDALKNNLQGEHYCVTGDLTCEKTRASIVTQFFSYANNKPVMLINNAGISQFHTLNDSTLSEIEQVMAINVTATIDLTRLFLQQTTSESTIVNVGSAFGSIGYPGFTLYCASKFALKGFTEALSREYTETQHRICYFAPRATQTPINGSNVTKMNEALGSQCDTPDLVASQLLKLLASKNNRRAVGWPEKFFARLNGVLPEIVDKAIGKNAKKILSFTYGEQK